MQIGVPLTRLSYLRDGNILFISHEAQDGKDGETCYETGATVQQAQRQTVPAKQLGPLSFLAEEKKKKKCCACCIPVAVVVVSVIASQSCQRTQTDSIREEDLGASIHPHL